MSKEKNGLSSPPPRENPQNPDTDPLTDEQRKTRTPGSPQSPRTIPSTPSQPREDLPREAQDKASADIPPTVPFQPSQASEADLPEELRQTARGAPKVPGYVAVCKLGVGTYGEVWLYHENTSGKRVAVKFLTHRTRQQWQLLQAEVQQLALLDGDPGIVQLKDVEPEATPPYYIMTFAEGGSLADRLARGPLPLREALRIFRRVTQALAYVHAKGIRHCDLKPGNVLLDAVGRPLVADFGQAHLESDMSPALGTFFYMAPEQADLQANLPDTRWDVYGLGALLYTMLTGHPPRADTEICNELVNTQELSHRLRRYREYVQQAPPLREHRRLKGIDRHLVHILDRCLNIDPDKRPHDAGAVLGLLERRKRILRNRPVLLFGLLAPVLLLAALAGFARWALVATLEKSEEALIDQLQQSDLTSARLVANVVEDELHDRKVFLERRALNAKLRKGVLRLHPQPGPRTDDSELVALLEEFQEQRGVHLFDGWVLVNDRGDVLAHYPQGRGKRRNFCFRDWFHGKGDRFDAPDAHRTAIRQTHLSQPYVGKLRKAPLLAISTPVFPPGDDRSKPIGVLMARVLLEDLYSWLSEVQIEHGFAVLVDDRYHLVRHRDTLAITPDEDDNPRTYEQCQVYRDLIAGRKEGRTTHEDPIDGREYLVSYAPLSGRLDATLRWGALVQHERQAALAPLTPLLDRLRLIGWLMLAAGALVTLGLWGWLIRTLRREEV